MIQDASDIGVDQDEADDVYAGILGEIGLDMDTNAKVGNSALPQNAPIPMMQEEKKNDVDDLEARLANL